MAVEKKYLGTVGTQELTRLVKQEIIQKVSALVDSAPSTLDTLNELAKALGNDPNFATTVLEQIGNKVDKADGKALSSNDYTTEEKTKLSGIENGANKTIVDAALNSASTNPVQNKIINEAINNLNNLIGDVPVSEQIQIAIADQGAADHNHDERYYTEGEVDAKFDEVTSSLSGKSDIGHNHDDDYDAKGSAENVQSSIQALLNEKVPASRTVNGKALSTDVTLTAGDVGADAEGAANSALEDAKEYTETYVQQYVTESILGGEW